MTSKRSRRLSVTLCGDHRHRTPLAYDAYRPLVRERIDIVDDPRDADVLVFGFSKDIATLPKHLLASARKRSAKLVVLSEEPLWDTVWSKNSHLMTARDERSGADYFNLNHFTTDIFSFATFPYFITTHDSYFARYRSLLFRNSSLNASDFLDIWSEASTSYAFIAEKRLEEAYDVRTEGGAIGLSRFRSSLAEAMKGPGTLIRGAGWAAGPRRQQVPDWHLEKLADLDRSTRCLSAIENTFWDTYVTEKIFDAYATCSIPITYASSGSASWLRDSAVNVYGMDVTSAAAKLTAFVPDRAFANRYRESTMRLTEYFMQLDTLHAERTRVATKVVSHLLNLTGRQ